MLRKPESPKLPFPWGDSTATPAWKNCCADGKIATPSEVRLMNLKNLCDRPSILSLVVSVTAKQRLRIEIN
ncbi:hypothetical protein QT974_12660 [Microcoleus sp. herbarium12]